MFSISPMHVLASAHVFLYFPSNRPFSQINYSSISTRCQQFFGLWPAVRVPSAPPTTFLDGLAKIRVGEPGARSRLLSDHIGKPTDAAEEIVKHRSTNSQITVP
jgi:hypothetical protein